MKRIVGSAATILAALATLGFATATQAAADPTQPVLGVGSQGPGVWCVQRILNRADHAGLAEDSIYGDSTRAAVVRFQSGKKLAADGIVGSDTGNALLDSVGGDDYCYQHLPASRQGVR